MGRSGTHGVGWRRLRMANLRPQKLPPWSRLATIGVEYAAAVGGFGVLGWWVDGKWGTAPWGVLICATLGLIGATYNLIRQSMAAFPPPRKKSDGMAGPEQKNHNIM